jgi:hypothetical protein
MILTDDTSGKRVCYKIPVKNLPNGLSLRTLPDWGCYACGSAHGTGIGNSGGGGVSAKNLEDNCFYYADELRSLFVISYDCKKYFRDFNFSPFTAEAAAKLCENEDEPRLRYQIGKYRAFENRKDRINRIQKFLTDYQLIYEVGYLM